MTYEIKATYEPRCFTYSDLKQQIGQLTAERDRLAAELAELKKKIDESPELKIFQAADMWSIKLDELSMLFGFGMYNDMKPGETRRFKLVETGKEGAE